MVRRVPGPKFCSMHDRIRRLVKIGREMDKQGVDIHGIFRWLTNTEKVEINVAHDVIKKVYA